MGSRSLWDSPGNTPFGVVKGLLLEYVGAGVRALSLNGAPTAPSPDFFEHSAGPRLAVPSRSYVRGERREEKAAAGNKTSA